MYEKNNSSKPNFLSKDKEEKEGKLKLLMEDSISEDLIDGTFVNDEGVPIFNDYKDNFDALFGNNYHIRYNKNKFIYFFTLSDLLNKVKKIKGYGEELINKKIFYGIINKYFPNIKDIRYMTHYNSFSDLRNNKSIEINKYLENYENINKSIDDNRKKLQCKSDIYLLKLVNSTENKISSREINKSISSPLSRLFITLSTSAFETL